MRKAGLIVLVGTLALCGLMLLVWLLGLVTGFTAGGLIHLLLILAIALAPMGVVAGIVLLLIGGKQNQSR
ncbi:MAG: hypothetical protein QOF61_2664 [Acidobacteriota bacterium]|nr:hypothetical protein [Acidobacteriota bacterium]